MASVGALICAASILGTAACAAVAEERPGSFGFSISVDADGLLDPTVRSITVDGVVASSPAAAAGIVANDRIVEVEGRQVAGAKANDLKANLKRHAGEAVHLRLERTNGERYGVTMIAAPKS